MERDPMPNEDGGCMYTYEGDKQVSLAAGYLFLDVDPMPCLAKANETNKGLSLELEEAAYMCLVRVVE